ncbi:YdeI/OmpD-associated family protein [Lutibacter sp.]|uniref:YdeI/OmpD-associated family protein n=1 Tax=Lutibacter sp. TaxID=1925666 RepID=UPI002733D181|nr:YdeI/OmpD-associated family protein [Lutibacter sp.]MDP3312726.1 YdeI/OmpD-associated family protein [Lutibacter sp.]
MRTIKFTAISELNKNQLIDYLKEAFLNSEQNAKHFVKKTSEKISFEIPEILQNELNNNNLAKENFDNMAYTYRKEYALYISDAKRETIKLSRLENVILNLERNIKMHEQYKC